MTHERGGGARSARGPADSASRGERTYRVGRVPRRAGIEPCATGEQSPRDALSAGGRGGGGGGETDGRAYEVSDHFWAERRFLPADRHLSLLSENWLDLDRVAGQWGEALRLWAGAEQRRGRMTRTDSQSLLVLTGEERDEIHCRCPGPSIGVSRQVAVGGRGWRLTARKGWRSMARGGPSELSPGFWKPPF